MDAKRPRWKGWQIQVNFLEPLPRGLFSRKAQREPSEDEGEPLPEESEDQPSQMEATVDRVLHTLNLPTRSDVESLNKKIVALAERIEALRK